MWILFSILAAFIWSIVNIIDKTIMTKFVRKPIIPLIVAGFLSIIFSLIIWTKKFVLVSGWPLILCLLVGAVAAVAFLFYFKAIQIEEVSRVVPLFAMTLIWTAVLAGVFLKEKLVIQEYFGIFVIFLGSLLISTKKFGLFLNKALLFVLISTILYSINIILNDYLLDKFDYWTVFSYTNIGFFLVTIPLFVYYFPDLRKVTRKHKALGLLITSESLTLVATLFFLQALFFGLASLVRAVNSVHYLFVFLWTILLSIWFPKIIKEELRGSIVALKLVAIILIISGVILVL